VGGRNGGERKPKDHHRGEKEETLKKVKRKESSSWNKKESKTKDYQLLAEQGTRKVLQENPKGMGETAFHLKKS